MVLIFSRCAVDPTSYPAASVLSTPTFRASSHGTSTSVSAIYASMRKPLIVQPTYGPSEWQVMHLDATSEANPDASLRSLPVPGSGLGQTKSGASGSVTARRLHTAAVQSQPRKHFASILWQNYISPGFHGVSNKNLNPTNGSFRTIALTIGNRSREASAFTTNPAPTLNASCIISR
jgi:hypothetical protein